MKRMRSIVLLTALWVLLWRDPSIGVFIGGLMASATTLFLVPEHPDHDRYRLRPLALGRLAALVGVRLVQSNIALASAILRPSQPHRSGIVTVDLGPTSDLAATIVAHCVTLTPGTLTIDVDLETEQLRLHALDVRDLDGIRADVQSLHRQVLSSVIAAGDHPRPGTIPPC